MKKYLSIVSLAAVVVMTGCSSKQANVETPPAAQTNTAATSTAPEAMTKPMAADAAMSSAEAAASKNPAAETASEMTLGSVYFDLNKYNIRDDMKSILDTDTKTLTSAAKIRLEGNCDERGSDEYNMALGLKRTQSVKEALTAAGVKGEIESVSLGETSPVCTDHNEACWSKNRRVDFKLPTK